MSDFFTFNEPFERSDQIDRDDLAGFKVEATDGSIGTVLEGTYDAGDSYLIVDTGKTILSKKVLLPAGVVERVDMDKRRVYVNRSKDDIKAAPEFDEEFLRDAAYRDRISSHYRS